MKNINYNYTSFLNTSLIVFIFIRYIINSIMKILKILIQIINLFFKEK
jgi:hypothetical protein